MKNLFFLLISAFILTSCGRKYEQEIKEVEALEVKVTALKETFVGIDRAAVNEAREEYTSIMAQIKNYYQSDTIAIDFGNDLNHYKAIKKAGKNMDQLWLNYEADLEMMEMQLRNLKVDIENNVWVEDSVKAFISFEKEKVEELSENIGTFIVNCDVVLETQAEYADKVKKYAQIF